MPRSQEPQQVDKSTWYYEEPKGILVVREVHTDAGQYIKTEQVVIPWRMIRASLGRVFPKSR